MILVDYSAALNNTALVLAVQESLSFFLSSSTELL